MIHNNRFLIINGARAPKYVLSAINGKMYRQMLLNPTQRDYQRTFRRNNNDEPIIIYRLKTVRNNISSNPFLPIRH